MSYAIALWGGVVLAGNLSFRQISTISLCSLLVAKVKKKGIAIVILAAIVGVTIYEAREFSQSHSIITKNFGQKSTITARVTSDPHLTKSRVIGSRLSAARMSVLVRTESVEIDGVAYTVRVPVRVLLPSQEIRHGELWRFTGRTIDSKERRVAALLIADTSSHSIRTASPIFRDINLLRDKYVAMARNRTSIGARLIPGIVIGDTRLEPEELLDDMRQSGLTHLTAVSGANFAIVITFVLWLTSWFVRRKALRALAAIFFLSFFVLLVRPSPSVLRAAVMAMVVIVAMVTGSKVATSHSLAMAIVVVLMLDPYQAFDPGFVLSVLATAGLVFLGPWLERKLERFFIHPIAEPLAVTISATILCAPYLLFLARSVSLGTIFFNCAVAIVIAPITIIGFLSLISLPISPPFSALLFSIAEPCASWVAHVASLNARVRNISLAPILYVAITLVIGFSLRHSKVILMASSILILSLVICGYFRFPGQAWRVGQCDVGQGDALLINLGRSSAILVDAGPDPVLLRRCLKEFRVKDLPLVILTHNHADHFQGITGKLPARIGEVWISHDNSVIPLAYTKVRKVHAGDVAHIGDISLTVLWPDVTEKSYSTIAGDGSLENNRSIVIAAQIGEAEALVTGDIEPGAQDEILHSENLRAVSILKVPHHGSRYQSDEFLSRLRPSIALISVGQGNRYGHPSPRTIEYLRGEKSQVFRTDQDGALAISWKKEEGRRGYVFSVRKIGKEWWQIRWL